MDTESVASTVAGIVLFQPDPEQVFRLTEVLEASAGRIVVFVNGAIGAGLREGLRTKPSVVLRESDLNLGIGAALNEIVLTAASLDYKRVILFDQDSLPAPLLIRDLASRFGDLVAAGQRPAVVAPRMVPATTAAASKAPTYRRRPAKTMIAGALPVDFVPTSGSLIDIQAWRAIGPFRADYFIDGIDLEWSFRAWASGYSCWIVPDTTMPHSVGSGVITIPFSGRRMPNQRPFRMYCTVRNTVFGWRLTHVPLGWKLRQGAYLPVQMFAYARHHRFRLDVVRTLLRGLWDGALGRLGVPDDAPTGAVAAVTDVRRPA